MTNAIRTTQPEAIFCDNEVLCNNLQSLQGRLSVVGPGDVHVPDQQFPTTGNVLQVGDNDPLVTLSVQPVSQRGSFFFS